MSPCGFLFKKKGWRGWGDWLAPLKKMQCEPCEPEEQEQQQQQQEQVACGDCDAGARRTCARCRVRIFQNGVGVGSGVANASGGADVDPDVDPERAAEATGQVPEPEREFSKLMSNGMYAAFDLHAKAVHTALETRRERLRFASNTYHELVEDAMADSEDMDAGLGVWREEDVWQGDVNLRTLNALLERVDQRGFERHASHSNQKKEKTERTRAHVACARARACVWGVSSFPSPPPPPPAGARTSWNFTRPFSKRARGSSSRTTGRFPSRKSAASTAGKKSEARS